MYAPITELYPITRDRRTVTIRCVQTGQRSGIHSHAYDCTFGARDRPWEGRMCDQINPELRKRMIREMAEEIRKWFREWRREQVSKRNPDRVATMLVIG